MIRLNIKEIDSIYSSFPSSIKLFPQNTVQMAVKGYSCRHFWDSTNMGQAILLGTQLLHKHTERHLEVV